MWVKVKAESPAKKSPSAGKVMLIAFGIHDSHGIIRAHFMPKG